MNVFTDLFSIAYVLRMSLVYNLEFFFTIAIFERVIKHKKINDSLIGMDLIDVNNSSKI